MSQILKTQTIRLDTLRPFAGEIRGIVAGDTGNRLQLLLEEDGTALTLEAGHRAVLVICSGRGVVTQDSAVAGNGVTFTPGSGQVNVELFPSSYASGVNLCVLQLYSTGQQTHDTLVSAIPFSFVALPGVDVADAVSGWSELPALQAAIQRCTRWFVGTAVSGTGTAISAQVDGAMAGDLYFNRSDDTVYRFNGHAWERIACLKGEPGGVLSVNGRTGTVTLSAADLGAASLGTNGKVRPEQTSAPTLWISEDRTLELTDAGKLLLVEGSSPVTITVPAVTDVAFPMGTELEIARCGTGSVTVAAASGVGIRSVGGARSISDRYAA